MGVYWAGAESSTNVANVGPGPGGNGSNSNNNNQTGNNSQSGEQTTTKSGGHKLLDQLNELKAKGMGGTSQAQELERYLSGVEQKYQSGAGPGGYEGESLYPDPPPPTTEDQYEQAAYGLSEWEKIQKLASLEAGQEKYAKSWEGQEFIKSGKKQGFTEEEVMASDAWRDRFGMPSIIAMSYRQEDPIMTGKRTDEFGQELGGEYIYSGQGRALMDQLEGATSRGLPAGFDYQQAKEAYWSDRTAQEERVRMDTRGQGSYGSGGGEGGGGGYYGDPRTGNPIDRYGNFYTPQANLQQAMVNVHATPTGFASPHMGGYKRGGIVSLLRLGS
jgi:hypothetical protein